MGTREEMKGIGLERTFFIEKIELRKGWAKGKGDLGGNIAIYQKSPRCVLKEVLGHEWMSWESERGIWKGGLVRKKLALGKRGEDGVLRGRLKEMVGGASEGGTTRFS